MPPRPGAARCGLVQLSRGGFGPEVDLGPISLNLPPDGEDPETQHSEDKYLLHDVEPFHSDGSDVITLRSRRTPPRVSGSLATPHDSGTPPQTADAMPGRESRHGHRQEGSGYPAQTGFPANGARPQPRGCHAGGPEGPGGRPPGQHRGRRRRRPKAAEQATRSRLVGVDGLEPSTSSLSGCRSGRPGSAIEPLNWCLVRDPRPSDSPRCPGRPRARIGPALARVSDDHGRD